MNRVLITTIATASLLLGAINAPTAHAQTSASPPTATGANANANNGKSMRHRGHRGMQEMRNATPDERAAVRSIMRLERMYMTQGRVNDIKPLLDNVKRKTTNPTVVAFVDRQLERLAKRPTNPDQQIATLTQKLNDTIAKLQ